MTKPKPKTITLFDWPGGGTWGLHQLVFAHYLEELSGLPISELSDVNFGRSIGSVGATSSLIRHPDDPNEPKFKMSDIIKTFYSVAHNIFGNTDITQHQKRGVEHDLRRLHEDQRKKVIFREYSDKLHLEHSKLSTALTECYGDTKISELLKTTVVLSQHFETMTTVAHTYIDPNTYNTDQWSIIKNMGDETRVVDAVMSSTAAQTVFNAYTYDGGKNHFVDGAAHYGPFDTLLNLQNMHDNPVKFRIITLGTGDVSNYRRDPRNYRDCGWLRMSQEHINSISNEMLQNDYARMKATFQNLEHVVLDTDIASIEKKGAPYQYTPFQGEQEDLDFIMETAIKSAKEQVDTMKQTIEDICEDRIRDTMPSIGSSRLTEQFYKALRQKYPRLTPIGAIKYENAILKSQETDIATQEAFSIDGLKSLVKKDLQSLHNTTEIPPSKIEKIVARLPIVQRFLKPSSPSPA